MVSKLIVALDVSNHYQAMALSDQLDPNTCALKIGSELFTSTGPDLVRAVVAKGFRVFLDLKFHDIPHTVAQACKAAADLGVWMLNVHAAGGLSMMQAAKQALMNYGPNRPYLIAVTLLTSLVQEDIVASGVQGTLPEQVERLALLAQQASLDGVVCSALEVARLKMLCGDNFLTVTPGIRLPGDAMDDQRRVITPQDAIAAGSDFLVMGRSITRAPYPKAIIDELLQFL